MNKLAIDSIYKAIEGEGVRVGTPQIFVRFQGCNIGCVNCDSKDTWDFLPESEMYLSEVIKKVEDLKIKNVSITGGDPLHQKHIPGVLALVEELKKKNYFINIEAAGTKIDPEIFDRVDFISFDYKTPSTKVKTNLNLITKLINEYAGKYQIKSVIFDKADFLDAQNAHEFVSENINIPQNIVWCLTPAFNLGEEFPQRRFEKVLEWTMDSTHSFKVVGQQHKWVYGADRKQV